MQCPYGGKYQRLQRIGNGAYGVIYKIRSLSDGQILIAKHIPVNQLVKDRSLQQIEIISKLKHHYIVKYYQKFIEEDELVIIMEYCGEKDLAWHIEQRKKNKKHFNESLVGNWIFQMLLAVGFMHSNKIVHRDLKPQNIFVDSQLNLKIGDFGISRLLDSTHQNCKTSAGTPSYMAPEMIQSQNYGFKADIWSLGCVIYEVCSLERLFPLKDAQDKPIGLFKMMDLIKNGEIKQIPSFYSKSLKELVRKMLIRNPNNRPRTQQLLKDKLLVDLMIKRIDKNPANLKQQYPKTIQAPSLSESLLQRQSQAVHLQMKKMSQQLDIKLKSLKDQKFHKAELQKHQRDVRMKMKELEKVVQKAFEQLYRKGHFVEQEGEKVEQKAKNPSKLTNNLQKTIRSNNSSFSDVTIKSMNLSSAMGRKKEQQNQSSIQSVESLMIKSKNNTMKNESNLSCTIQSQMISSNRRQQPLQDPFQGTIQSQYSVTNNNPAAITNTMSKLDMLQQTLKKNPQALLSDSFLNCTLSLSNEFSPSKKQMKMDVSGSIQYNFARQPSPPPKQKTQKSETQETEYKQDFEQYEQNEQIEDRRAKEMETMLSLYEQTLADLGRTENSSSGRLKNKYLVMSQIKQQSNQGGSMISREDSL